LHTLPEAIAVEHEQNRERRIRSGSGLEAPPPERGIRLAPAPNSSSGKHRCLCPAEALFIPKQQITEQSVSNSPLPPTEQSARKPRVLAASSAAPVRLEEVEAPVSSKARTMTEIPISQFARIRAWVKYGMTAPQIAEVYGVGVAAIERILRKA
jgi:hypothetical protein